MPDSTTVPVPSVAKGESLAGTGSNTGTVWGLVPPGTDGQVWTADSSKAAGVGWATPAGGSSAWTTVKKLADESHNNSAVVADDASLRFTTLPNTQYAFRFRAFLLTNATADAKYRLVHTGTTTRVRRKPVQTTTADIPVLGAIKTAFDVADVILSTTGLNPYVEEEVILQVGASGGEVKFQWGQVTSNAGPTSCLEGSYLEWTAT